MDSPKPVLPQVSTSSDDIELQPIVDNSESVTSENASEGEIITEIPNCSDNNEERDHNIGSQNLASVPTSDAGHNQPSSSESEGIESNTKGKFQLKFNVFK